MTSTLEKELTAAGYTPESVPINGDVAWTGWHAPVQKDTYEVYYDLICGAMYDHIDSPPWAMLASADASPWKTPYGLRSPVIYRALMDEYRAVIDCWRSVSQVPPAPEAR